MKTIKFLGAAAFAFACSADLIAAEVICDSDPLVLPFESTVVVTGREASCAFALKELNEIVKKATGRGFKAKGEGEQRTVHRIFIGRSEEAERLLGKKTFDSLGEEESLVVAKGNDLFLAGGDVPGVLWSVYDFVEDNLDYHWYDRRPGKDVVGKFDVVTYRGKATRRQPVFRGSRAIEAHSRAYGLFKVRNRANSELYRHIPGWKYRYSDRSFGHGYELFLPAHARDKRYAFINAYQKIPDRNFERHPEWFSLGPDGKRSDKMQLCFSNLEMRDALYEALKAYIADEKQGGPGVYMLGVNDDYTGTMCYCDKCRALDRLHDCGAGAHWEMVADICNRLKRDGYADVFLISLAYRHQCEKAPKGVFFPDNFIVSIASGNHSHTLTEWGEEPRKEAKEFGKPGEMYSYYGNAVEWGRRARISHWLYTDPFLTNGYRIKKELVEMLRAGAIGAFSNGGFAGSGGGHAFGSINDYLVLRLLYDPTIDVKAETDRIFAVQYGPAAFAVRRFYDMLEEVRQSKLKTSPRLDGFGYFTGRQLAELGRLFDAARAKVSGTDFVDNFDTVGMYVDMLLTVYSDLVAKEAPDYAYDPAETGARAGKAADNYINKWLFGVWQRTRDCDVEKMLAQMAYYPLLKTKELPEELKAYPAEKVTRILPEKRRRHEWYWFPKGEERWTSEEDPTTACGWTCGGDVPAKVSFDEKHPPQFNFYEHGTGKYLILRKQVPMDFFERGKYKLFCLGMSKIRPTVIMNFGTFGGGTQAILSFELRRCADPIFLDKEFEIWANVKAEGPMFFKEDAGRKNRLYVAEYFVVDKEGVGK